MISFPLSLTLRVAFPGQRTSMGSVYCLFWGILERNFPVNPFVGTIRIITVLALLLPEPFVKDGTSWLNGLRSRLMEKMKLTNCTIWWMIPVKAETWVPWWKIKPKNWRASWRHGVTGWELKWCSKRNKHSRVPYIFWKQMLSLIH